MSVQTPPIDYNQVRAAFAREISKVTGLDQNHVIVLEPETPNNPRPSKPYMGFKITTPGARLGDDDKRNIAGTTKWNSGGQRKMTVQFEAYGTTHEEAYNYLTMWQGALDLEDVQADLRAYGLAVWTIGTVADASQLLNTGYEGRSMMDCFFGIASNMQSDLGSIGSVEVTGQITSDQGVVNNTDTTVTGG